MVALETALIAEARNLFCTATAVTARGVSIGASVYDNLGLGPAADAAEAAAQLWSNANNVACSRAPVNITGQFSLPFQGGQCPDSYNVGGTANWLDGGVPRSVTRDPSLATLTGPLSVEIISPSKQSVVSPSGGAVTLGPDFDPSITDYTVSWQVIPVSGNPDNCGDPPEEGPVYNPNEFRFNPTIDYDDDNGDPQTITPEIQFKPITLSPTGDFVVPIEFNFGNEGSLFGDFNLTTGDINIGNNNSIGDGIDNEPRELEDEEENDDPDSVVVGVRIISSVDESVVRATTIFQSGGNPNIYAPALGFVTFQYELPSGGTAWGPDIPVKNTDFVVWSPRPALTAKATPNIGASFTTRLLVEKQEKCCSQ